MYKRNTEAPSCNHFCGGKAISITYCVCVCVCVFVALGIQDARRIRHIDIYGLPGSTILSHIIS